MYTNCLCRNFYIRFFLQLVFFLYSIHPLLRKPQQQYKHLHEVHKKPINIHFYIHIDIRTHNKYNFIATTQYSFCCGTIVYVRVCIVFYFCFCYYFAFVFHCFAFIFFHIECVSAGFLLFQFCCLQFLYVRSSSVYLLVFSVRLFENRVWRFYDRHLFSLTCCVCCFLWLELTHYYCYYFNNKTVSQPASKQQQNTYVWMYIFYVIKIYNNRK